MLHVRYSKFACEVFLGKQVRMRGSTTCGYIIHVSSIAKS